MLALEREDSALLPGSFRLAVGAPDQDDPTIAVIDAPFALIGRTDGCAVCLDHPAVSRRHAYLQAISGRIYCIDLGSRCGTLWEGAPRKGGWLDPDGAVQIGPYRICLLDTLGIGSGGEFLAADFDPLASYAGQLGSLPRVELEFLNRRAPDTDLPVTRLITLVGSSPRCKLRLEDPSVSPVHASLLWLRDGLWVINLDGKGGVSVNGKSVRCARLADGDEARVGTFLMRAHYLGEGLPDWKDDARQAAGAALSASAPQIADSALRVDADEDDDERAAAEADDVPSPDAFGMGAEARGLAALRRELDDERAALDEERAAFASRQEQLDSRETKIAEAQQRLAAEWDRVHADRAALTELGGSLSQRQADLQQHMQRLTDETESLGRQRKELAARAAELEALRKRLKADWHKVQEAKARLGESKKRVADERSELARQKEEFNRRPTESATSGGPPPDELEIVSLPDDMPADDDIDVLDSMRHNKVFHTERVGSALVVTPLGDASDFHYGDVHTEANKVRRLLEAGTFRELVVDLGGAPLFGAVTMNVVVAVSRIVTNRGGRAVLCNASEKMRTVLQTMKLLEFWPLFEGRGAALEALREDEAL